MRFVGAGVPIPICGWTLPLFRIGLPGGGGRSVFMIEFCTCSGLAFVLDVASDELAGGCNVVVGGGGGGGDRCRAGVRGAGGGCAGLRRVLGGGGVARALLSPQRWLGCSKALFVPLVYTVGGNRKMGGFVHCSAGNCLAIKHFAFGSEDHEVLLVSVP